MAEDLHTGSQFFDYSADFWLSVSRFTPIPDCASQNYVKSTSGVIPCMTMKALIRKNWMT
jgi:hypothetical protein